MYTSLGASPHLKFVCIAPSAPTQPIPLLASGPTHAPSYEITPSQPGGTEAIISLSGVLTRACIVKGGVSITAFWPGGMINTSNSVRASYAV